MSSNLYSLGFNVSSNLSQYGVINTDNTKYAYFSGTVECWIYNTVANSGLQGIIVKNTAYGLFLSNNALACYDWKNNVLSSSGININTNTWYHVAFVFQDGIENGSTLYLNGFPVLTFTYGVVSSQSAKLAIASGNTFATQLFYGYIDEVRIWNTARNDQQILQNYNTRISSTVENLTGYWTCDDGSGTILANLVDSSSYINLYNSPVWSNGYVAPMSSNLFSLSLNQGGGSSQYAVISTDNNSYAYNNGTIECWIYITGTGAEAGGYQAVIVKQGAYSIYLFNNQLIAYDWNTNSSAYSNITLNTNTWYHIAFVFQSGVDNGSKFYVNGYPVSSFKYTCLSQSQKLSIASGVSSFSAQPFNGYIDELRIWNTVRNDQQILQKYNIRINPTEGLTGYWLFDNGSGSVATNLVSGGPSFTLYNSTGWSNTIIAPIFVDNTAQDEPLNTIYTIDLFFEWITDEDVEKNKIEY